MSVFTQYLDFGSPLKLLLGATSLAIIIGVYKLVNHVIIAPYFSPLRDLPGPKNPSFIFGNFREIFKAEPGELHKKWVAEYGPTLVYKGFLNNYRLMTFDTKALTHVLNHSYEWQKPEVIRINLAELLGEGVLFAEGDSHKRQRRVMNPSFSLSHLRELTVVFHEKSQQLRDIWLTKAAENGGSYSSDVMSWLGKATLDVIGLAGFNYEFNALNSDGQENELNSAFMTVFKTAPRFAIFSTLQAWIPLLRVFPTPRSKVIANAGKVMNRIGRELVEGKKQAILATATEGKSNSGKTQIERSSITTRDILSRLMAANMATDLVDNQRLSDEEVFAQIPTFLVAGNETTSTATTWCLYALSRDLAVQSKLRDELLSLGTDSPTMDELNALPYLDSVVRETLRVHSPVSATIRIATKDDVLPLGTPIKDKKGRLLNEIRVKKGETIFIPISPLNTYQGIWGEDSDEFRPERWQHVPEKAVELPGVYSNILSFLAGPRSCIGYRFAIVEFKCLIFALVRGFVFEPADPSQKVTKKSNVVTRPFLESEAEKGPQLPLKMTPWRGA